MMRTITIPLLYTPLRFSLSFLPILSLSLLLFLTQIHPTQALEFRSISGPPEQGGSIDPGGVLVIACTLQYPGKLESGTDLFLVGSDGKRTQATYSGFNSTTAGQSFSTVGVPKEVGSGWYFLVAVESANNTVIASSTNFKVSANVRDSSTVAPSSLPSSTPTSSPDQNSENKKPNGGAIAGGVVGGLLGLVAVVLGVLVMRRRRQKQKQDPEEFLDPYTVARPYPYPPPSPGPGTIQSPDGGGGLFTVTSPSDTSDPQKQTLQLLSPTTDTTTTLTMREQKEQMLGQKEHLERRIDQIRRLPPLPTERSVNGGGEGEGGGETVVGLRNQVDAMTQRIAMLEAELADLPPPDYVSSYGGR
ncbi:hypothetical protein V5O48_013430 [Marasmius crinis-equi]|uniref:receptor protein-tyrosine kinase n=1 Tax=Marasmius crinis-equi TaxID=585013 RepID=A0ABR3F037_9AGAR